MLHTTHEAKENGKVGLLKSLFKGKEKVDTHGVEKGYFKKAFDREGIELLRKTQAQRKAKTRGEGSRGAMKDGRRRNPPNGFSKHGSTQRRTKAQNSVEKEVQGAVETKPKATSFLAGAKEKLTNLFRGGSSQQAH